MALVYELHLGSQKGVSHMNRRESRKVFRTGWRVVQALAPAHLIRQMISLMLVVLLVASNAQARTNTSDWRAVENLKAGTDVIVKAQHKYFCRVEGANDDQLVCEVRHGRFFQTTTLVIPRAEIQEVRTLPNQAKDAWIGAGIGAGAGAIAAGTTSRDYPGFHAFVGGVAGAGAGALVGGIVPIFELLIKHGKIIYKR
jgi:hypothetical protein